MIDAAYMEKINSRITELETRLSDPKVSNNRKLFQELLTEHSHQKKIQVRASSYFELVTRKADNEELAADESDPELAEMAREELEEINVAIPAAEKDMRISLLPPDPREQKNTIVEIRAGTGGDEAGLFAGDLYRMYQRFADLKGWKAEQLTFSESGAGGIKEVSFSLSGADVYRLMQYESGVHRVQRVPETETQGRVHTSAATVAVLPEAEEVDVEIKNEDIRIDSMRASGPGGQSVNTTDSAIRITHLETGLVVTCQDEKSKHRNKDKAMTVLRARLYDLKMREEHGKMADERRSQIGSGDRSERIRTYNFPQNRLSDHRINLTLYSLDRVMAGELDDLIHALYEHDVEERLKKFLNA